MSFRVSVMIFFPFEVGTKFLQKAATATVQAVRPDRNFSAGGEPELLQAIIKPLTNRVRKN